MTSRRTPEEVIAHVTSRLRERFPEPSADEIERIVRIEIAEFVDRPVQDYVSVLTERAAAARLRADEQR